MPTNNSPRTKVDPSSGVPSVEATNHMVVVVKKMKEATKVMKVLKELRELTN